MNYGSSMSVLIIILLTMYFLVPVTGQPPINHWFSTSYFGDETYYYDVIADSNTSLGGTGLIYAVGASDGSPIISAFNPDGSLNWTKKYNVMGKANTVTKRIGVYASPDNLLFIGGEIYAPNPMSLFLVVDALSGNYIDGWTLSTPGFEGDKVNDLVIGPDGAVYGVGTLFTNIDPIAPYNTLLFRYDPSNLNVTYSQVFLSTEEGHALDVYNGSLYIAESKGIDMYLREVDYSTGLDTKAYRIYHNQVFQLTPRDIEVIDGKAFIVGSIITSSLFVSMDLNGTLLTLYSHTQTTWRNIEVGNNNRLFIFGDSKNFPINQNDTSYNLIFLSFYSNVTGYQSTDVYSFGGIEDDISGGFHINEYGYISGYTDSFPYLGLNRSGIASLISPNMSDFVWSLGCVGQSNVTISKYSLSYGNLVQYLNITDAPLGSQRVDSSRINVEPLDIVPESCIAYDINNPVVINEFQVTMVIMISVAIVIAIRKYLRRR